MEENARGADGRRLFTQQFKKEQIGRVLRGEITQAKLCRKLDVEASVVRNWRRLVEQGSQVYLSLRFRIETNLARAQQSNLRECLLV